MSLRRERLEHRSALWKKFFGSMKRYRWGREDFFVDTSARYQNNGMVVQIYDAKAVLVAILSVNIPGKTELLEPGEFYAKTWTENAEIAKGAMDSGLFEDTGIRVPTGFVEAQLWRIKE